MRLLSYAGVNFAALGVSAGIVEDFPGFDIQPGAIERAGSSPAPGSARFGLRPIPALFGAVPGASAEAAFAALIAALDPLDPTERPLRARRGNPLQPGPEVEILASVGSWQKRSANTLALTFHAADPVWRGVATEVAMGTVVGAGDGAIALAVSGSATARPVVSIAPTAQRGAGTATVGWRWRRRVRLTNTATSGLYRYPWALDLGRTDGLVAAGKARADGADLRLVVDGGEVPRELVGWNGPTNTRAWFLVPGLAPGASMTVEVWYGNENAGPAPGLVYPDRPAFDLAGSTNALRVYPVARTAANDRKGAWRLDPTKTPPDADFEAPGAWRPALTLPNPDNTDDVAQARFSTYVVGAATYRQAAFDAQRWRSGARALPDEGTADGIALYDPLGIVSVRADFEYTNWSFSGASSPYVIGKLMVLARDTGAELWATLFERATYNPAPVVIPAATYAPSAPVKHVAFAVWPQNEIEVYPNALFARFCSVRSYGVLEATIDAAKLVVQEVEAEIEVYEIDERLRLPLPSGGWRELRVGGPGRRVAVRLGERLDIDGERRTAEVRAVADGAFREVAPVAVVEAVVADGLGGEAPTGDWLPLRPGTAVLAAIGPTRGGEEIAVAYRPGWL